MMMNPYLGDSAVIREALFRQDEQYRYQQDTQTNNHPVWNVDCSRRSKEKIIGGEGLQKEKHSV